MYGKTSQTTANKPLSESSSSVPLRDTRDGLKRKALRGERIEVEAIYEADSSGCKNGRTFQTVLVTEVRDTESNELLADHLWFRKGKELSKASLGDHIRFSARPIPYRKGYHGLSQLLKRQDPPYVDYKLTPPQELSVVARNG